MLQHEATEQTFQNHCKLLKKVHMSEVLNLYFSLLLCYVFKCINWV